MRHTYYLSYSGGMDSAYVLYLLLSRGEGVLLHHTRLKNSQGRDGKEYASVQATLDWLDAQDLPGWYDYIETTLDMTQVPYFKRDIYIWAWQTGCLLSLLQYQHIKKVATGRHLNSYTDFTQPEQAAREGRMLYQQVLPLLAGREDIHITHPIGDLTKKDIIDAMPRELRALTWSCRRPTREGQRCHRCTTCRHIDMGLQGEAVEPYRFD